MGIKNQSIEAKTRIAERRALVATWTSKGYSAQEISKKLAVKGFVTNRNEKGKKGKPLSVAAVKADIKKAEIYWRQVCAQKVDTHKARQLQELNELRKCAWEAHNHDLVLKIIDKAMALLGTKAPPPQEKNDGATQITQYTQYNLLSDSDRNGRVAELLDRARERTAKALAGSKTCVDSTSKTASSV